MAAYVFYEDPGMAWRSYACEVCRHRPPDDSGADSGVLQRAADVAASRAVWRTDVLGPLLRKFESAA